MVRLAARHVPEGEPIRGIFDETTYKKSGSKIEEACRYRNGAGTAHQEWRTLYGVNFVIGIMRIRLQPWPESFLSIRIGLRLYLKKKEAARLDCPYPSRSELAGEMLELVSEEVGPERTVVSIQDGNYSTKEFLRGLPENADVVGRLPIDSKRYEPPEEPPPGTRGRKPRKGALIGSAKTLLTEENPSEENPSEENPSEENPAEESAWHSHPTEDGVWIRRIGKEGHKAGSPRFPLPPRAGPDRQAGRGADGKGPGVWRNDHRGAPIGWRKKRLLEAARTAEVQHVDETSWWGGIRKRGRSPSSGSGHLPMRSRRSAVVTLCL